MKRMLTMMIIGILCLSMFSVIAPKARALAGETPLQVAEKAAAWTISQAIYENGGYKWADYMQGPYYDSSVQYGSAGFGTLYLELYKKTGNSMYLDYAKGAAQWIISQAVPDSGGYKWPHHDDDIPSPGWWLSPAVSGIGEFLLQMYKTTGNTVYLDYATGAAQWLMAMAYWGEPGCFIPYNPPNPYGTQAAHGIDPAREAYTVTFLLHMYEETGNNIYLKYVTDTAEWLISGPDKIVTPLGYEWRFNRPFYNDYPLDGEGRIALFFYEIYEALGNPTYLEYARGAMNWLLNQAVVNGGTAKWFDPVPERGCYRTLPFSGSYMGGIAGFWGVPEPNELLMAVYEITNNATYLDYATKLANWITSPAMAIPEGGGYKFPDAEGGSTYSAYQNARIYNFLSWLYSVTGVTSYSEYADGALQWIIFNATEANGGYEWRTLSYFPYYATWFEQGAAGIGYYLVSACEVSRMLTINNLVTLQQVSSSDPKFSIQQNFIVATPPSSPTFHDDFDNLNSWYEREFDNPKSDYSFVSPANSILQMTVPESIPLCNKINTTMTFKGDCLTVEVQFRIDNPQPDPNYAIFLYTDKSSTGAKYQELDWEYNRGARGKQTVNYYYTDDVALVNLFPSLYANNVPLSAPWDSILTYSAWTTLKFVLRPDHFSIYMNGQAIVPWAQVLWSPHGGFTASNFYLIIETTNNNFPWTPRHLSKTTSVLQVDSVNVDSSAMYWVQNIVTVGRNIPGISSRITSSVFRIYEMPEMTQAWEKRSIPNAVSFPVTFNLTSCVDGNQLVLMNNASSFASGTQSVIVMEGSYIVGYPDPIDGFTHQSPEIVIVGGQHEQIAAFVNPTSGTVKSSVKLIGESAWRQTQNVILNVQNHPQTAEESRDLKWSSDGAFQYSSGSTDQGITFFP